MFSARWRCKVSEVANGARQRPDQHAGRQNQDFEQHLRHGQERQVSALSDAFRGQTNADDRSSKHSSLNKHKDAVGYNAHCLKGNLNRNILKAKMEIRTGSDCNDNEYNLILKHDKASLMRQLNTNIVFSPSEDSSVNTFAPSVDKACKKSLQSKSRNPVAWSQEHASNKFVGRNDPYQNAFSDKIVVRTASEKRVSNNSKCQFEMATDQYRHAEHVGVFEDLREKLHQQVDRQKHERRKQQHWPQTERKDV